MTLIATAATQGPVGGFSEYVCNAPAANWSSLPVAMGLAIFCNEGMVILIPPIHESMGSPSWPILRAPVVLMSIVFTLNYMTVAVSGAYLFSVESPKDDISLSFDTDNPAHRAAVFCYIGQLTVSYVVVFFSVCDATSSVLANPRFNSLVQVNPHPNPHPQHDRCVRMLAVEVQGAEMACRSDV